MKNLSCHNLWTLAFLNGKDSTNLLVRNLQECFKTFQSFHLTMQQGVTMICLMPCDMATHNALVDCPHMTCFRCLKEWSSFRVIFVIVIPKPGQTVGDLAEENDCSVDDIVAINPLNPDRVLFFDSDSAFLQTSIFMF